MKISWAIILVACFHSTNSYPEQGKWDLQFSESSPFHSISKSMFANTEVKIDIARLCEKQGDAKYGVQWIMFHVKCYGQVMGNEAMCFENVTNNLHPTCGCPFPTIEWMNGTGIIDCSSTTYTADEGRDEKFTSASDICPTQTPDKDSTESKDKVPAAGTSNSEDDVDLTGTRKRREDAGGASSPVDPVPPEGAGSPGGAGLPEDPVPSESAGSPGGAGLPEDPVPPVNPEDTNDDENLATAVAPDEITGAPAATTTATTTTQGAVPLKSKDLTTLCTSWKDGPYEVYIVIKKNTTDQSKEEPDAAAQADKSPLKSSNNQNYLKVTIETRDSANHLLSEVDLPKLYFYLTMTIIYVLYGFMWLLMLACYWRDILRIQYFIGLVIILGFVEKVFFYSEYEHVDKFGITSGTMVIVAELVSVAKRTLSRALVVVVAVGFGLVKPRLGPTLHKLLAVCFIYFVLASVESCLRAMQTVQDSNALYTANEKISTQTDLLAAIPLALCETGILYWVFSSLLQTIRTLRLRRNIAKLSLYRHFTNLLIFTLLVSIGYFIWYMLRVRFTDCIEDNKELWLADGFWSMLFSIMLFVIMILWRPSINNQRYSHSLLLNEDGEDDEEDTLMGTEAFEAKKRTHVNGKSSARDKRRSREEKVEDDLQWIEDNIPASVADSALQPVLNDSEEEIMTTRFELSKMD